MASRVILSNFFEKQSIQNHPQYLSGLSRAIFTTTFLEIAVYMRPLNHPQGGHRFEQDNGHTDVK